MVLKRGLLIVCAIGVSFIITEMCIRYVVGFPALGVGKLFHVYPNDTFLGSKLYENIYRPHNKYHNTESGYHVFRYNNLGLIGKDVSPEQDVTAVLGNSFIEARAINPQLISTSVMMDCLQSHDSDLQVVNLGKGGLIPDLAYYRLKYWESRIKIKRVMLVLEDHMIENSAVFGRKINESWPSGEGYSKVRKLTDCFAARVFTLSALLNCFRVSIGVRAKDTSKDSKPKENPDLAELSLVYEKGLQVISDNLLSFKRRYGLNFFVVSLMSDDASRYITKFCDDNGIALLEDPTLCRKPQYSSGGSKGGHLNEMGNKALGTIMGNWLLSILN